MLTYYTHTSFDIIWLFSCKLSVFFDIFSLIMLQTDDI